MTPEQWLECWEEFDVDREPRATEKYPSVSRVQLQIILGLYDGHSGDPTQTIEAAIGDSLAQVTDSNDEEVGLQLHPGVKLNGD